MATRGMNRKLKTRKAGAPKAPSRPKTLKKERHVLECQVTDVATRVRKLESFIAGAPRAQQESLLRRMDMVPPPDFDLSGGGEHFLEARRLSYGRQQRLHQIRRRNLALCLSLLCLAIGAALWLVRFLD